MPKLAIVLLEPVVQVEVMFCSRTKSNKARLTIGVLNRGDSGIMCIVRRFPVKLAGRCYFSLNDKYCQNTS